LRSAIDEFNETRRFGPAFEACVHPKVSFQDEIGACETRDEVRDYLEGFADAIGGLRVEVEETRDLGDTVLSVVRQSGRGSASSAFVEQPFTWVLRFEDGRCVRWRIWADHERALEDAGLSE
jgi:ketosteroid isomerase-like protein